MYCLEKSKEILWFPFTHLEKPCSWQEFKHSLKHYSGILMSVWYEWPSCETEGKEKSSKCLPCISMQLSVVVCLKKKRKNKHNTSIDQEQEGPGFGQHAFPLNIFIFCQQISDIHNNIHNYRLQNDVTKDRRISNFLARSRSPPVWGFSVTHTSHYSWKCSYALGCSKDLHAQHPHRIVFPRPYKL